MSVLGTSERPLRVAIVGSGPSGFFAADALLKSEPEVTVDMFERLPTPYGLVRLGVAPDHPKIKTATRVYERTAQRDGFTFLGNVTVGQDIAIEELRDFYDATILAYGAETDRALGIPGEDLPGSHTATEFVAWYNGHPDYRDHQFDLSKETALVIGQGNVAADVCRILAKTVDELKETDIAAHALDALAGSNVKDIYMIGRRGPVQAKFTQIEIKELGRLADCDPIVQKSFLQLDKLSQAELDDPKNTHAQKIFPILQEFSQRPEGKSSRRLHFVFLRSPKEISGNGRVERLTLEINELVGEVPNLKAKGTGETETLDCGIIFRSVGYRGEPLSGAPFDEGWGIIPNRKGRVMDGEDVAPGLYAVGWIKRGPTGIIGTNKPDSAETVQCLLEDIPTLTPCKNPGADAAGELLAERGVRVVSFDDWKRIDAEEVAQGKAVGKPREKFTRKEEMLHFLANS